MADEGTKRAVVEIYDDHAEVAEAEHHEHHGGSLRLYWGIAVILGAATLIEVWLADYLKALEIAGSVIAASMLSIAIVKAMLVILYYMHLRYEKPILSVIFAIPFALVSLLVIALFANP